MPPANQPRVMSEAVFHKNFGAHALFVTYVLLTVHLSIILVNDQLDAQLFFRICLFQVSTHVLIIRRINCINMTFGICHCI
jgi:hypothetical protein